MPKLSDLPAEIAAGLDKLPLPEFTETAWHPAPRPSETRVAIVTSAGLHRREDPVFVGGATDYRIIPGDIDPRTLVMSHVSVNFDRGGFVQDSELVFPIGHLRAMADEGAIASVAGWHYAFMGASDPAGMVESGHEVGRLLREDRVDVALFVPV